MNSPLIIQRPQEPRQLFLLFHGAGGNANDMQALGSQLASTFPQAAIVSLPGLEASADGQGNQWLAPQHDDLQTGIANALPAFVAAITQWQADTGVEPQATALIGFSQGGAMVLECTQRSKALAGRAIVLAGHFGVSPTLPALDTTIHLLHGYDDEQSPRQQAEQAAQALTELGSDFTLDILPGVAHELAPAITDKLLERLLTTVPRRVWEAAMREAGG